MDNNRLQPLWQRCSPRSFRRTWQEANRGDVITFPPSHLGIRRYVVLTFEFPSWPVSYIRLLDSQFIRSRAILRHYQHVVGSVQGSQVADGAHAVHHQVHIQDWSAVGIGMAAGKQCYDQNSTQRKHACWYGLARLKVSFLFCWFDFQAAQGFCSSAPGKCFLVRTSGKHVESRSVSARSCSGSWLALRDTDTAEDG